MPQRPRCHRPNGKKVRAIKRRRTDRRRGTSAERGYGAKWQRLSIAYRRANPLCVECRREGRVGPAECVDHIIPHKGDPDLFWDQSNWQSSCKHHHDQKTGARTAASVAHRASAGARARHRRARTMVPPHG